MKSFFKLSLAFGFVFSGTSFASLDPCHKDFREGFFKHEDLDLHFKQEGDLKVGQVIYYTKIDNFSVMGDSVGIKTEVQKTLEFTYQCKWNEQYGWNNIDFFKNNGEKLASSSVIVRDNGETSITYRGLITSAAHLACVDLDLNYFEAQDGDKVVFYSGGNVIQSFLQYPAKMGLVECDKEGNLKFSELTNSYKAFIGEGHYDQEKKVLTINGKKYLNKKSLFKINQE